MANEILYAGLADQRLAEVLSVNYIQMIADRNALPNHPALHYAGDLAAKGSTSIKVPHIGLWGYDLPSQVAEGMAAANTALSDNSTVVSVAKYSKSYEQGDIAKFTDSLNVLNAQTFAADAMASSQLKLTQLIGSLMGGFSSTVGASGVDLSLANWLAALALLEVGSQGSFGPGMAMAVLHPQQLGDLRTAIGSASGGAIQWMQASQEQMVLRGNGYRGQYMGVDLFSSSYIPSANAGADRAGGVFVKGAVIWADMSIQADNDPNQLNIGGKVLFERDRSASSALTQYVSHSYKGVAEGLDSNGVAIITDL